MAALPVAIVSAAPYPQPPAYSVWHVIREQARIVAALGHEVQVVAPAERSVEDVWPDGALLRTTAGPLPALAESLSAELPDEVLILTHDLVTSSAGLDLIERVAEAHPGRRFAHWLHGQPGNPGIEWTARYPLPRAWYVGQAAAQLEALARVFKAPPSRVRAVPNHRSVAEYLGLGPIAASLADACDWFGCGVRAVLPARRSENKDWPALLALLGAIADAGETVGLIGLDWAAGAGDEPDTIDAARTRAEQAGVRVALSSDLGFARGVPRATVRELLAGANVFILPSVEETSSLVTAEALLGKNLVVLDAACSGAREVAGESALYLDFARVKEDPAYRADAARQVQAALVANPVLAGQQRVVAQFDSAQGREAYARLLADMTDALATGLDEILCDPALAQPFRALLDPLVEPDAAASLMEPEDGTVDSAAGLLDRLGEERGVDGVGDAFLQLCSYERAARGHEITALHDGSGRLGARVILLPYTPLLRRYAGGGYLADGPEELATLLAESRHSDGFVLLRPNADGVDRAVVDGGTAEALERWLAGGEPTDPAIDELREAGFLV